MLDSAGDWPNSSVDSLDVKLKVVGKGLRVAGRGVGIYTGGILSI